MSDYQRTTRECTLETIPPTLATTLRDHIEKYELGNLSNDALICCETISTREKKGLFKRQIEQTVMIVVLTPQWLIWTAEVDSKPPATLSARLRDIQVQDYEKSEMHNLVQDTGLNISGLRTNATAVGTAFIGLGPEPAAQKFRDLLKDALLKV
jgi:hypothetical protein